MSHCRTQTVKLKFVFPYRNPRIRHIRKFSIFYKNTSHGTPPVTTRAWTKYWVKIMRFLWSLRRSSKSY